MMFTLYSFSYLLITLLEALIAWQYLDSLYESELGLKVKWCAFIGCYAAVFLIANSEWLWLMAVSFACFNFLLTYFLYGLSLRYAIEQAVFMAAVLFFNKWWMAAILMYSGEHLQAYQNQLVYIVLAEALIRLVYFTCLQAAIQVKYWMRAKRDDNAASHQSAWGYLLYLIPVSAGICLITEIRLLMYGDSKLFGNGMLAVSGLLLLLVSILAFWGYHSTRKHFRETIGLRLQDQKDSAVVSYYKMLAERNEEQKILIHDIRKHLNTLAGLLENKEYEEAGQYTERLSDVPAMQPDIRICDNPVLNLILAQYREKSREKNVSFNLDIRSHSLHFLSFEDLTALMGNLLDNALEAAAGSADAFIDVHISQVNRRKDVISITNSCKDIPMKARDGSYVSGKKDIYRHGYGMKSIRRIIVKYQGEIRNHYVPDEQSFYTTITLYQEERKKHADG